MALDVVNNVVPHAHNRGRKLSAYALTAVSFAAVLVALRAGDGGRETALFGGHEVDPSMPAPLLGGDDDALPEGGGEWGGVGAGGTFLGRSMSKRRRIINNQRDLWNKAEQGIGNLVAMSKGKWQPAAVRPRSDVHGDVSSPRDQHADSDRLQKGEMRSRRGETYGDERRHESYYDEVHSQRHSGSSDQGQFGVSDGSRSVQESVRHRGARESELRERRVTDERRGKSLDEALSDASPVQGGGRSGTAEEATRHAGHDVTALRSAIARMQNVLGSTKERLQQAVRRDEQASNHKHRYADSEMPSASRTSELVAARRSSLSDDSGNYIADSVHVTNRNARHDALGHKIEWPLLDKGVRVTEQPSDTDEAEETVEDSISGLEKMVGTVEDDVHGFLKRTAPPAHKEPSDVARQFRERWANVAAVQRRKYREQAHPLANPVPEERKKVYIPNALSDLALRAVGNDEDDPRHHTQHPNIPGSGQDMSARQPSRRQVREGSESEMRQLEQAVAKIEHKISNLGIHPRQSEVRASEDAFDKTPAADEYVSAGREELRRRVTQRFAPVHDENWHDDEAPGRRAVHEATRATRRAAHVLSHQQGREYGAVVSSDESARLPTMGATAVVDDVKHHDQPLANDLPPLWSLYPNGELAVDGTNSIAPHFATDGSARDAFRRQFAHIIRTTSAGDQFTLPTDVIDANVDRRRRELAAPDR